LNLLQTLLYFLMAFHSYYYDYDSFDGAQWAESPLKSPNLEGVILDNLDKFGSFWNFL
jgi:hypothetical protein